MSKRMLSLLVTLVMVLGLAVTMAFAAEETTETVNISNNSELVQAIANQKDGQTWVFTQAGAYDAKNTAEGSNGTYAVPQEVYSYPFALPIYADNLTITKADGVGDVTLTSSYVAPNGNWHEQNFITVFGTGVTIDGVDLQANRSDYYGTCNKVIELYGEKAKDFTLRNVDVIALQDENGTSFGGSIYFNVEDAGTTKMENVTMDAWISASKVTTGTIAIDGLTQDFTNSSYAGYSYEGYGYAWNPTVNGSDSVVSVKNYTIVVDDDTDLGNQIFNDKLRDGTTIQLLPGNYNLTPNKAYVVEGQSGWYMPVTKSVTIQGVDENRNVITDAANTQANLYSTVYAANGAWASQNLITVFADDVVLEGVTIMNKVAPNKAIEVVGSEKAMDFTVRNCRFAPISEDLLADAGLEGKYSYQEYAQYGASLYFSAKGKYEINAQVENNRFSYSTISLGATTLGSYQISGNTFEGAKNWNQDPDYYYSTIGYQGKWLSPDPDCTTLGEAVVNITDNTFANAGSINFSQVTTGSNVANLSGNTGVEAEQVMGPVKVEGQIAVTDETSLKLAVAAAGKDDTVVLAGDIALSQMLDITKSDVTIDLNGYALTAGDNFTSTFDNDAHLVQVNGAANVTFRNGKLVTSAKNKHGMNLYNAAHVVLEAVTINHTVAKTGAPLVVNGSSLTIEGHLNLLVGENSWYGINVDPKEGEASVSFAQGASVTMTGNEDLVVMYLDGEKEHITISGALEAGLDQNENGTFVPHQHVYGDAWVSDESGHWHACACGDKHDQAQHTFQWVVDRKATATQAGSKHQECSVCGYALEAVEIPATGSQKPDAEQPQTGDAANVTLWVAMLFVSVATLTGVVAYTKKRI